MPASPLELIAPGRDLALRPVCVGFSGGLDSSVLLHRLRHWPGGVRALHVDHGLNAHSGEWARHCAMVCAALGIAFDSVRVDVATMSGLGLEGAARAARHAAFAEALDAGELLALAHHQRDQAETFLLRALRASGPDGLAAMQPLRPFARGWLWRPLLDTPLQSLHAYAEAHALRWIEDPSNAQSKADRNFLRNAVLPMLRERWPQVDAAFARSAALQRDALQLAGREAAARLQRCRVSASVPSDDLSVRALRALPAAGRADLLRRWVAALGLPPLPGRAIAIIERDVLEARHDARPRYDWHGARIERWGDLLHAGAAVPARAGWDMQWDGHAPATLPCGGHILLEGGSGFVAPLRLRARAGGERLRLPGRSHHTALKQLLQTHALPPWLRECLPVLTTQDGAVLAAGEWADQHLRDHLLAPDARLRWSPARLPCEPAIDPSAAPGHT